ncbi:MotA/TolQ/ExbB proton channel family protein [Ferrimonas balearica]|uniref:MotA/TolQ/ExbB proton channel family protein n=1 Tax=Ferrimonas balearica TaxID=44012 RepID=UPI001C58333B|nr:MotA/TolQ/ExbB proton channel family protein [Ferrimonas balearica]MBW3138117.1 MotA/TolQ/ExbB proton channel family protein [Ferrimonas balearica]
MTRCLIPTVLTVLLLSSPFSQARSAIDAELAQRVDAIDAANHNYRQQLAARSEQLKQDAAERQRQLQQARDTLAQLQQQRAEQQARITALAEQLAASEANRQRLSATLHQGHDDLAALQRHYLSPASGTPEPLSLDNIRAQMTTALDWLAQSATIAPRPIEAFAADGQSVTVTGWPIGGILPLAQRDDGQWGWLRPLNNGTDAVAWRWQPAPEQQSALAHWQQNGAAPLPLDLSGGGLTETDTTPGWRAWFERGGALLWPLVVLFASGLLCALWRAVSLWRLTPWPQPGQPDHRDTLRTQLQNRNDADSRALLQILEQPAETQGPLLQALSLTLWRRYDRGLGFIALCAALAPMLGLLGTVTGMMATFDTLTLYGNAQTQFLSGGISEALITTQAGLLFALPLLLLHYPLKRRAQYLMSTLEAQLHRITALNHAEGEA